MPKFENQGGQIMFAMQRLIMVTLFCLVLSSPLLAQFGDIIQATGDYDGDGASDIVWRNIPGQIFLVQIKGGTIVFNSDIASMGRAWTIVGSRDFNGDGKADILWRDTAGNVAVWLMD